ncbi:MAG: helix-turn-helix transcriptional regulator [Bradyrhizobium sp.]|uniref:helix-turn-helix transcriptional regulator n=1 Tax=Bradyrhizobium sp. TaxID=376 RepID=UPI003D109B38
MRRHFIKEWREHRGLTQEQAAERVQLDRTTLGRIENRRIAYTQPILEALAEAYSCEPWDLLHRDPSKEGHVVDFLAELQKASPVEQRELLGYWRGMRQGRPS